MTRIAAGLVAWAAVTAGIVPAADPIPPGLKDAPAKAGFPRFKVQEIATDLKIGYAVITADLNGDGKPDIVVVDQHRVVWYENPTWKVRTILQGKTKPDNVCVAALDVDGDKKLDLVLGAGWKPSDTTNPGTLQWLGRGKSLDDEWTLHPIPCDEPTVHRVRLFGTHGDGTHAMSMGKPEFVVAPLMGRGATAKGNWLDGRPVRLLKFTVPKDPTAPGAWKPEVISEQLHVVHNIAATYFGGSEGLLTASYKGIHRLDRTGGKWAATKIGEGNQSNPAGNRGASEVRPGSVGTPGMRPLVVPVVASVEPWHGNQVVTYTQVDSANGSWDRHLIDDHLRWGHAVAFANLDGVGADELIVGVRDDPNPKAGDTFTERHGIRLYKCTDGKGAKWDRHILEDGGVAVEDLTVADLNGDGKPDIIAVGRATGNCRIYWNQGPERPRD